MALGSSKFTTVVNIQDIISLGKLLTLMMGTIHAIVNYDFGKNWTLLERPEFMPL